MAPRRTRGLWRRKALALRLAIVLLAGCALDAAGTSFVPNSVTRLSFAKPSFPVTIVDFSGNEHDIRVKDGQSVLEALESHGMGNSYDCRRGNCLTCACRVVHKGDSVDGMVDHRHGDGRDGAGVAPSAAAAAASCDRGPEIPVTSAGGSRAALEGAGAIDHFVPTVREPRAFRDCNTFLCDHARREGFVLACRTFIRGPGVVLQLEATQEAMTAQFQGRFRDED